MTVYVCYRNDNDTQVSDIVKIFDSEKKALDWLENKKCRYREFNQKYEELRRVGISFIDQATLQKEYADVLVYSFSFEEWGVL